MSNPFTLPVQKAQAKYDALGRECGGYDSQSRKLLADHDAARKKIIKDRDAGRTALLARKLAAYRELAALTAAPVTPPTPPAPEQKSTVSPLANAMAPAEKPETPA